MSDPQIVSSGSGFQKMLHVVVEPSSFLPKLSTLLALVAIAVSTGAHRRVVDLITPPSGMPPSPAQPVLDYRNARDVKMVGGVALPLDGVAPREAVGRISIPVPPALPVRLAPSSFNVDPDPSYTTPTSGYCVVDGDVGVFLMHDGRTDFNATGDGPYCEDTTTCGARGAVFPVAGVAFALASNTGATVACRFVDSGDGFSSTVRGSTGGGGPTADACELTGGLNCAMTGQMRGAATGNAANPSWSTSTADTDTGFYPLAANTIGVAVNGGEVARVTSSGFRTSGSSSGCGTNGTDAQYKMNSDGVGFAHLSSQNAVQICYGSSAPVAQFAATLTTFRNSSADIFQITPGQARVVPVGTGTTPSLRLNNTGVVNGFSSSTASGVINSITSGVTRWSTADAVNTSTVNIAPGGTTSTLDVGTATAAWRALFVSPNPGTGLGGILNTDSGALKVGSVNGVIFTPSITGNSGSTTTDNWSIAPEGLRGPERTTGQSAIIKVPGIISAAPTLPNCTDANEGAMAYVDSTGDGSPAMLCFCRANSSRSGFDWAMVDDRTLLCEGA